jgi:RNA polymerase sigma-70 factor (ECF subfamily)
MFEFDKYIEAIKQKDEDAFSIIYNETKHAVYALILSITKNRSSAEDIMQEVYLTVVEKINYYKMGSNFLTWILTISRNKAIDYYRRNKKETLIDPSKEYNFPTTNPNGEQSLLINEVLDLLTDTERSIFMLKVVENLKHREISKILNLPLGTVIWHYNKAVKKVNQTKEGK